MFRWLITRELSHGWGHMFPHTWKPLLITAIGKGLRGRKQDSGCSKNTFNVRKVIRRHCHFDSHYEGQYLFIYVYLAISSIPKYKTISWCSIWKSFSLWFLTLGCMVALCLVHRIVRLSQYFCEFLGSRVFSNNFGFDRFCFPWLLRIYGKETFHKNTPFLFRLMSNVFMTYPAQQQCCWKVYCNIGIHAMSYTTDLNDQGMFKGAGPDSVVDSVKVMKWQMIFFNSEEVFLEAMVENFQQH